MNKKTQTKPRSRRNLTLKKKKLVKKIKDLTRRIKPPAIITLAEEPDFLVAIKKISGLRTYDRADPRFNDVHPESSTFQKFNWLGLLTLKFHSASYSKDDRAGQGHKNRQQFLTDFMENLRATKFKISDREFNWVACEEFGSSGMAHFHVLFSFDCLKDKGREDKIPQMDFAENGDFDREGRESLVFTCQKLGIKPSSVVFHWSPMWENSGLVNYFSKIEFGRPEKSFELVQILAKTRNQERCLIHKTRKSVKLLGPAAC